MDYQGNVLTPFNKKQAADIAQKMKEEGITAVAVCFLHGYANNDHELAMQRVLSEVHPEATVTLSHELSREYREY